MKNIVSLTVTFSVVVLAMASMATADVPGLMQYQGYLTDESGEPLDTIVSMTFTIYDASTGSGVIWTETQDTVIVANGLFNVLLGSVNPISDTVFADTVRWLGVMVDPDPEIVPRTRLVTVPYAYRVATVDGASGGAITGDLEAYAIITGVVMTGDVDASGNIHASGTISSGSSITIDGTNDKITTTSGMIDFDDENLVTTGRVGIGAIDPAAKLHVESFDLPYSGTFTCAHPADSTHVIHAEFAATGNYDAVAVYGSSVPADGYGYGGYFEGGWAGVFGYSEGPGPNMGVQGVALGSWVNRGVYGAAWDSLAEVNYGVYGTATNGETKYAVYGHASTSLADYAGYFFGNVEVTGTITKGGGYFKIDHPLDPENKYLCHSSVESPDMKNVYDGVVLLDANGEAVVELPYYFGAVNKDFRYQLTAIGAPGPNLYVAEEISDNRFKIAGGEPGMKVSWLVTGIRKDPFAEATKIQVEVDKSTKERGKYLHPEAYGLGEEYGIHYEQHKLVKELQEKSARKMEQR